MRWPRAATEARRRRGAQPENILLRADGYVMLTDFGFAKDLRQTGRTHSLCGTPEYMVGAPPHTARLCVRLCRRWRGRATEGGGAWWG